MRDEKEEVDHHLQKVKLQRRIQTRKRRKGPLIRRHTTGALLTSASATDSEVPVEEGVIGLSAVINEESKPVIDPHSLAKLSSFETAI